MNKPTKYYDFLGAIKSLSIDLKDDFYAFFKHFWGEIEFSQLNENWHIKYLCDELSVAGKRVINNEPKEYDLVINVPPGSTKSRITSIMFPVWLWINNPTLKLITASYSGDLADDFAIKSRDIIRSKYFKIMYPEVSIRADRDRISKYENTHSGERQSIGFNGTVTGKHADVIIIDDPLKAEDSFSTAKRTHANRVVSNTLSRRKRNNKVTLTILIMQRLHEDDPTSHFLKKEKVKHICLPGQLTDDVKPDILRQYYKNGLFDNVRMDNDALREIKSELGSFGFAAQILQNPLKSDSVIFNPEWWNYYDKLPDCNLVIQVWDTAYKQGQGNDYSVCGTWGIAHNGIYLIDLFRNKITYPDLEREAINQYKKHLPKLVLIEDAASGQSLIPSLKRKTRIPIKPVTPKNKVVRAHEVSPVIENRFVYIPEKASFIDDFIREHTGFPNSTNDDIVDTTTMALEYLYPRFSNSITKSKSNSISKIETQLEGY